MDPISSQGVDLAKAVQALLVRQGPGLEGALQALLGQDVELLLQALTSEGAQLQLPSGQVVTAQGELPYPEGTLLKVRVQAPAPGDATVRLQLQEARPPAAPALLAPLVQGEAQTLAARLGETSPASGLLPLLELLSTLSDGPAAPTLPASGQVQAALAQLPEAVQASLKQALGADAYAPVAEVTQRLLGLMREASAALPPFLSARPGVAPAEVSAPSVLEALVQQLVARLAPDLPEGHRSPLETFIRTLLQPADPATTLSRAGTPAGAQASARAEGTLRPLQAQATALARAAAAPASQAGLKAGQPESWETWIRGTVQTLSDPAVSPREAAFHALQAKEGTAYFELPLPWAQASPLQLWVEADAPDEHRSPQEDTKRVLLGLRFSRLGETRLGMAQGGFGLRIRVWTEHPEALEADRPHLEEELKALDKPFDLKIYALSPGPDGSILTVRSLAAGSSLSALG
jgi:hypothetical protein